MEISFLIKGLIVGSSIAAPIGPIGILCIQRTITYGIISGLFTGLGAATADGLYGVIAAFGLTMISNFLIGQLFWLRLIGGIFLLYLSIKTFLLKPIEKIPMENHGGLIFDYLSTTLLTLTNPITILSFIAIFTGLELINATKDLSSAILMIIGIFIGSMMWWFILSIGMNFFRNKLNKPSLAIINKISSVIIFIFAIIVFINIFI